MNQKISIHGSWFAAFFLHTLLIKDFSKYAFLCDFQKFLIFPSGMSIFTFHLLEKLLDSDQLNAIWNIIDISEKPSQQQNPQEGFILSPRWIYSILNQSYKFPRNNIYSHLEDIQVYAKPYSKGTYLASKNFPFHLVYIESKYLNQINFESIYKSMPFYGFYDGYKNYHIAYYHFNTDKFPSDSDISKFLNEQWISHTLEKINHFPIVNQYCTNSEYLFIWSGLWMTPIILWISNQLVLIDSLLTIMYIVSNDTKYIKLLKKLRKKLYKDIEEYLDKFNKYQVIDSQKIFKEVDTMSLYITKLYLDFK